MKNRIAATGAALIAACAACFPQITLASGCADWATVAELSASMRDRGIPEDRTSKFIGTQITDDQTLMIASTLNHRIYTDPTLRAMAPKRVANALMKVCQTQ
ncbi:hypothetical protein WT88_29415 [Burkholderia stagnalis]|uniref:hypothetical protein n=1 Tax=Burkholderia stagnalis TaxID=1503054 RepID=UPI00075EFC3D|nr:hypothetical protein [Burkholderia stagnalis]KVZ18604.1 hypothetical protein WT35_04355 [Burkholderia stagnalis]KWN32827.1 hypothetical protein WT86_18480 [Burkholderia stagnalis]KWN44654.1 hypothetical protein WT88_29415 [Burkholderia stagnalis]KWN54387.1 hypothetical protein WT87_03510 [Burkholderia stagnalis]KWO68794.1 hypothetical protein WT99_20880 [Burkholderia stagnalis]